MKYPFIGVPVGWEGPLAGKIVLVAYFAILVLLCGYGFHRYLMVYLYYRHKKKVARPKSIWPELPPVTIQLPIFNELYVVERLIDATCKVDYPREKLEIQVLDDSTDETKDICRRKVDEWRSKGVDIVHIHRADRVGYKAGALDHGMKTMKGRFVAVFDADFLPTADFLERTIHHFTDDKIGMVQTRWGHLNRDYSMLTEVQSILLDGHFIMEHCARNRSGRFFNFSGTAGIWRREAIETAGGWQHDTLTEDLDLSFRSQLARWNFIFLPDIETPAELPVEMNGFKSQQYRWVKGSMQTSRKLLWRLMTSDIPLKVKAEAFVHLTGNTAYFMMLILSLLMFPVMYFRTQMHIESSVLLDFGVFALATISVCFFYVCSQREIHGFRGAIKTVLYVPMLLSLGIGMCVSNTRAVLEGLFSRDGGEFVRTPKYAIADRKQTFSGKKYKVAMRLLVPGVELALGVWFAAIICYSIAGGMYFAIPFQALFMIGFLYVAFLSIFQGRLTAR
ncbi:MAG TPA: cellulose synthase family protein, partial [Planctomycetota bacterium]|nr:cellulose synthase family protein [Planctomycetota bacterium]